MDNSKLNSTTHGPGRQKGTFIVKVDYCSNGTWQGEVTWADENRSERFRSMLELVKLMDEALAQGREISYEREA
ncbi:hypothetical protein [Butyrivibrio sp. FCS014]|uniref:hypothetical protein n=1 Tax=Butyrivibrio sp. FCS014 TaxID=1408304 RepID=UPI000465DE85|nr:hypothetical protein [Butyrivibrio sp. FCS014]